MPRNMMHGLIHVHIKVDTVGGTAVVTFHLPTPAPRGHKGYVYSSSDGFMKYSHHALFNATRDQVTVTFLDGRVGDDDGWQMG